MACFYKLNCSKERFLDILKSEVSNYKGTLIFISQVVEGDRFIIKPRLIIAAREFFTFIKFEGVIDEEEDGVCIKGSYKIPSSTQMLMIILGLIFFSNIFNHNHNNKDWMFLLLLILIPTVYFLLHRLGCKKFMDNFWRRLKECNLVKE